MNRFFIWTDKNDFEIPVDLANELTAVFVQAIHLYQILGHGVRGVPAWHCSRLSCHGETVLANPARPEGGETVITP
jgi:hypothetical protein